MFPFLSHGCLTFHRNTDFPWNNDLPFIACTTPVLRLPPYAHNRL
ncbi:DUF6193 family natural product biosynthesis protein [Streptomyces tubercidicus]|nr:DUF6193 family natural product biosynthesis protein [Streptomyces tubercidicus]WAU10015.1 DUF6193 family natural product biosynthesis protein [Streptomyces tubercidicus]